MHSLSSLDVALLAQHVSAFLESPYKPFLMFLPFVPWAWLISTKLDKDARYFHLNAPLWNAIHLCAGAAAIIASLFIPIFWVGWPVAIILLITPVLVYWRIRNQAVPEAQRYALSGAGLGDRMEQKRRDRAARDAAIQLFAADGSPLDVPQKEHPLYETHMLAEDIIGPAIDGRAAYMELSVAQNGAAITQTVDGIKYKREPVAPDAALKVVDYLKKAAGLDLEDRRRRQTGQMRLRGPNGGTDVDMTTMGSSAGLHLRLDFDRMKRLRRPFDGLGLLPSQQKALAILLPEHDRHGIVLIGAPPGQGLSTSMYSFLGRHDAYTSNIKTLEREILLEIDGIDHVLWDASNPDIDYPTALQSMLRRDPDVVMLSYVKDSETATLASEPGMQGPLLYIPQRAATIPEQIREWVKSVGDVKRATKALRAVTNQRLIRTLCPNCKQPYAPTAEQLKKLNLPADMQQLYRAGGKVQVKNKIENCPVCGGAGFLGVTAVFEVFIVDDTSRQHLQSGDLKAALAHARRNKMIYLQEAALSKVASGETTVEEVVRVTSPPKPKTKPVAGASA